MPIVGVRYKRGDENYDICSGCFEQLDPAGRSAFVPIAQPQRPVQLSELTDQQLEQQLLPADGRLQGGAGQEGRPEGAGPLGEHPGEWAPVWTRMKAGRPVPAGLLHAVLSRAHFP
eukprot:SAG22_NODE_5794_length_951_cov_1.332160_2_plen_116_part_00